MISNPSGIVGFLFQLKILKKIVDLQGPNHPAAKGECLFLHSTYLISIISACMHIKKSQTQC
jgi:hypothetical protein